MTKNTSIVLIAVIAAIIVAGALSVTTTTGQAFADTRQGGHNWERLYTKRLSWSKFQLSR